MGKQTIPLEIYKGTLRARRDAVRKQKAEFKLKLARDFNNHNEGYFRYVNAKQKEEGNTVLVLNSREVTNETEKAKVLNTFSSSLLASTVGPQALGTEPQADGGAQTHCQGKKSLCVVCDSSLASKEP